VHYTSAMSQNKNSNAVDQLEQTNNQLAYNHDTKLGRVSFYAGQGDYKHHVATMQYGAGKIRVIPNTDADSKVMFDREIDSDDVGSQLTVAKGRINQHIEDETEMTVMDLLEQDDVLVDAICEVADELR